MASSSATSASAGEHWTAPYRRLLAIGDSPVVLCNKDPPKHGEFKLVVNIVDHGTNVRPGTRGIGVMAYNSSMDMLGFIGGVLEFESEIGMQLYALRAAGYLVQALKDQGIHDGPVVYQSVCPEIVHCLRNRRRGEDALRRFMPGDLDSVRSHCFLRASSDPEMFLNWADSCGQDLRTSAAATKRDAGVPICPSANVSSDDGSAPDYHWTAQFRRRLGIGDSLVVLYNNDPPKHGEFKIIFIAHEDDVKDLDSTPPWTICAMALNSSMKPFGITGGSMKFTSKMGMQLCAVRAAGNLVKKLKDKGIHDGPVVYQSGHLEVTACLNDCQGEPEAVLPDDIDSVDTVCLNIVGTNPKKLFNWVDRLSTPALKALIKRMKENAGVR